MVFSSSVASTGAAAFGAEADWGAVLAVGAAVVDWAAGALGAVLCAISTTGTRNRNARICPGYHPSRFGRAQSRAPANVDWASDTPSHDSGLFDPALARKATVRHGDNPSR